MLTKFFILTFLVLICFCVIVPVIAQENSAQTAIASAQDNLLKCYSAVKDAEASGANVTSLTATLNSAADSLTQAQLAYASNDYSSAYNDAQQSETILNGLTAQAAALQQNAENARTQSYLTVLLSTTISVTILAGGIIAYRLLTRNQRRQ